MKFPLQYAKILSQKFFNIDDDIIPEIEMCLEREGDKVSVPYDVKSFGITIDDNIDGDGYGNEDGDSCICNDRNPDLDDYQKDWGDGEFGNYTNSLNPNKGDGKGNGF